MLAHLQAAVFHGGLVDRPDLQRSRAARQPQRISATDRRQLVPGPRPGQRLNRPLQPPHLPRLGRGLLQVQQANIAALISQRQPALIGAERQSV